MAELLVGTLTKKAIKVSNLIPFENGRVGDDGLQLLHAALVCSLEIIDHLGILDTLLVVSSHGH